MVIVIMLMGSGCLKSAKLCKQIRIKNFKVKANFHPSMTFTDLACSLPVYSSDLTDNY